MFSEKEDISSQGYKVKVEDTVGSGDAFTAGFATRYVETGNIKESADFANLIGGYVASKSGATPEIDWEEIKNIGRVTKKMPEGRRKS
jgi:fructokinase